MVYGYPMYNYNESSGTNWFWIIIIILIIFFVLFWNTGSSTGSKCH